MLSRARIFVSGDVHGVGLRYYAKEQADILGLSGFVKNLPDGRVEAVFEGEREAVEKIIAWARRGPHYASVSGVEANWEEPVGENGFKIKF